MFLSEDLFLKMADFWPPGPKDEDFKSYEKIKFIQSNIAGINEEAVDEFSTALGKVLRWIQLALELRIEDVKQRRQLKKHLGIERKEAQEKEKERMDKRKAAYDEAIAAFTEKVEAEWTAKKEAAAEAEEEAPDEEDKPEFDSDEWYAVFDEENFPIDVPDEIEQDIDNDFNIVIEES
jgi:hypothetical protein